MNKTAHKVYLIIITGDNLYLTQLILKNTFFKNPHGLSEKGNKSTASDLSRLCYFFM